MGYDPTYGARPLRRVIQKQLTDRLALALLKGELREGDSVRVDAVDGRARCSNRGVARGLERARSSQTSASAPR